VSAFRSGVDRDITHTAKARQRALQAVEQFSEAVREPLVVWNDGHHRWQIIQKHPEIPYRVKDMAFADEWAAIVWMCRNQLGRRNLNEAQRQVILADQYEAQKKTEGAPIGNENRKIQLHHFDVVEPKKSRGTLDIVAKDAGVSTAYVERAVRFSKGLTAADKVSPGFKDEVLSGEVKATIAELRRMPKIESGIVPAPYFMFNASVCLSQPRTEGVY